MCRISFFPLSPLQLDWTDKFIHLWQTQPWNFLREKSFNIVAADDSTRCCVCSLSDSLNQFTPFKHDLVLEQFRRLCKMERVAFSQLTSRETKTEELRVVVKRVHIQLPLTASTTSVEPRDFVPSRMDDEDELMTCTSCAVCVHKCKFEPSISMGSLSLCVACVACYGASVTTTAAEWHCQRCESGVRPGQDCCLCLLRGGALKSTDGGRWAHIVCALHIPDVTFGDEQRRQPIITEQVTRTGRKLVSPHEHSVVEYRLSLLVSPSP